MFLILGWEATRKVEGVNLSGQKIFSSLSDYLIVSYLEAGWVRVKVVLFMFRNGTLNLSNMTEADFESHLGTSKEQVPMYSPPLLAAGIICWVKRAVSRPAK